MNEQLQEVNDAMEILAKYSESGAKGDLDAANHLIIIYFPDVKPEDVDEDDFMKLADIGVNWDDEFDQWTKYVCYY